MDDADVKETMESNKRISGLLLEFFKQNNIDMGYGVSAMLFLVQKTCLAVGLPDDQIEELFVNYIRVYKEMNKKTP
jgi:hypothetical protein